MDGKAWMSALLTDEFVEVRLRVRSPDVAFVKGIMEASEGVGAVFAEPRLSRVPQSERDESAHRGVPSTRDPGALILVAPRSRAAELHELIEDLRVELAGNLWKDES
jgi:hypothetical protein